MRPEHDAGDLVLAADLDRRGPEAEHDPAHGARLLLIHVVLEGVQHPLGHRRLGVDVDLVQVGPLDHDFGLGHLAELGHLGGREGRLDRATASDHHDLLDDVVGEGLQRVLGDVGRGERAARGGEDPSHVERDVAVADHHRPLDAEVELAVGEVGMTVVPGHEVECADAAGQVLARDPEPPLGGGADGVEHGVVPLEQVLAVDVGAELDVAEEPEPLVLGGLVEGCRHQLDLRVVRCDPRPDQPGRGGQPLVHVHVHVEVVEVQQRRRGEEAGRTGAHDRHRPRCDQRHALTLRCVLPQPPKTTAGREGINVETPPCVCDASAPSGPAFATPRPTTRFPAPRPGPARRRCRSRRHPSGRRTP